MNFLYSLDLFFVKAEDCYNDYLIHSDKGYEMLFHSHIF